MRERAFVNKHVWKAVRQQMTGNVEWQIRTREVMVCGMRQENQGMLPLEFACTIKLIQESTLRDNSSAVIWFGHVFVVTKVRIQISEWVFLL